MYVRSFTSNAPRTPGLIYHRSARPPPLIILRQTLKVLNRLTTVKPPLIRLIGQNPRLHPQLPTPLHRTLGNPRPIEPAPALLEAGHLRLGVHQQPLLVDVGISGGIGVGVGAFADAAVGRAGGGKDGGGWVAGVHGAGPAAADVDVVEVGGAVGVGLGPFAAEGGAEAREEGQYFMCVCMVSTERGIANPVAGFMLVSVWPVHPEHAKLILFWCVKAICAWLKITY